MAGSKEGGRKAALTNKLKHGEDFYKRIGHLGGTSGKHNGGFASLKRGKDGLTGSERARLAGAKGGKKSKRGKAKNESNDN